MENKGVQAPVTVDSLLQTSLEKAKVNYPQIELSSKNACIALSGITEVTNDEQDAAAEKLLVKVRATFDKIEGMRKAITEPLDAIKKMAMIPEKMISGDAANKDSQYLRVKRLRDGYANLKLQKQKEEQEKAAKERAYKEEVARITAHFERAFHDNIILLLSKLESDLAAFFNGFSVATLHVFDDRAAKLNAKPKIKPDMFLGWFNAGYDSNKMNSDEFESFITYVKEKYTYDRINGLYEEQALPIIQAWKDKLPAKKKELEDLEELQATNAAEAAKKQQEIDAREAEAQKAREAEAQKKIDDNAAAVEREQKEAVLTAHFDEQITLQSMDVLPDGARTIKTATITCEPQKIVDLFARVMFACYSHPKFPGHIKRDRKGIPVPPDENGRPVYADWAETLLKFYADNCAHNIEGIRIDERVSTTQKSK